MRILFLFWFLSLAVVKKCHLLFFLSFSLFSVFVSSPLLEIDWVGRESSEKRKGVQPLYTEIVLWFGRPRGTAVTRQLPALSS
mmetsp:Transcript_21851/g.43399  ORF Transcript_21851/g.43399 Transcript_21851/m.43399 type:complete len:83 (+) Transcript_21851:758-1006(+)